MKKFLIIGLIVLFVVGILSVFATGDNGFGHKSWKKSGDFHKKFDQSKWLDKLGLPDDATDDEIKEAFKSKFSKHKGKRTGSDVVVVWPDGNKEGYKGHGFYKGCGFNS